MKSTIICCHGFFGVALGISFPTGIIRLQDGRLSFFFVFLSFLLFSFLFILFSASIFLIWTWLGNSDMILYLTITMFTKHDEGMTIVICHKEKHEGF